MQWPVNEVMKNVLTRFYPSGFNGMTWKNIHKKGVRVRESEGKVYQTSWGVFFKVPFFDRRGPFWYIVDFYLVPYYHNKILLMLMYLKVIKIKSW